MSGDEEISKVLSMRIITTENSLEKPVSGLDATFSSFRKISTRRVPVLHLFGVTCEGKRMCMHVHGVFPYIYIPLEFEPDEVYLQRLTHAIDRALNISLGRPDSYTQHVFSINIVHGIPYYGFHHKAKVFLKIYIYNALLISRLSDLLLGGAVMGRSFQPHETHIPFILQFFIDYNLYGMNFISVSAHVKRKAVSDSVQQQAEGDETLSLSGTSNTTGTVNRSIDTLYKVSTCDQEVDVIAADILNKQLINDHVGTNPGLLALWEDEKKRLQANGLDGEVKLDAPNSQERKDPPDAGVSEVWYQRFIDMVDALDICTEEDQQSFAVPSTPGDSSLNLSSVGSQEEVNQESINHVLNFSANLTQAAEKLSCQELAALLAEHLSDDDSTKDEEYISYSPRVSPQRDGDDPWKDGSFSYSPLSSPQNQHQQDTTVASTPTTTQLPSHSPLSDSTLCASSEHRSMSVLSAGSWTSQGSRRSAKALYKWSKKWPEQSSSSNNKAASQMKSAENSQSSVKETDSASQPMGQRDHKAHFESTSFDQLENSSIFSGSQSQVNSTHSSSIIFDSDDDDWVHGTNLIQVNSTFDNLYDERNSYFDESSDEDLQTTIMAQPVWEIDDDRSCDNSVPQLDGAEDDAYEDDAHLMSETIETNSSFQVSKNTNPLKFTIRRNTSVNEDTYAPPVSQQTSSLKLKIRRTSENQYNAGHTSELISPVFENGKQLQENKPKITLNFKSLTLKIADKLNKKKKVKEKAHKKKAKKSKSNKDKKQRCEGNLNTINEDTESEQTYGPNFSKQAQPTQENVETHREVQLQNDDASYAENCTASESCIPRLKLSKKGRRFTLESSSPPNPLNIKIPLHTIPPHSIEQSPSNIPEPPIVSLKSPFPSFKQNLY
ncbi:REV3L [Bugula neritina]|uniref:REV3L n=1 Tax=Bugula neritina TaxID=10212 RepID=A0A7J7IWQ9_BUGNE|nr:REV3L [Bugula neritina]